MTAPAERMRGMRDRRRARAVREVRLILPDARSPTVRQRVATQVVGLDRSAEDSALAWNEAIAEFEDQDNTAQP